MKFGAIRKIAATLAAGVAVVGFAACEPAPVDNTPAPQGWRLVGGDEFNSGALDTTKWKAYHNTYGDGNNEYACLTPDNVKVSGGTLKITSKKQNVTCPSGATRKYTSGFIGSRETGTYYAGFARFEIRARVPHAQGLWPAFWLRHRNGAGVAEVDVMEYFHSQVPGKSTGTLHLDGRHNLSKRSTWFENPATDPSGWHTWAVEISQVSGGVKFDFLLDGAVYHTYTDTQRKWASQAPLDGMWDMAINQAVGGNWGGDPDGVLGELPLVNRCSIGGTFPGGCRTDGINRVDWNDPADATYEVDWVRVYVR